MADIDGRIVSEYADGREVPDIAARYAVPEAYVERVVEDAAMQPTKRRHDWSLNSWGNRLLYSVIAGFVINMATGIYVLGTVITVVLFVLTTAIVTAAKRNAS